MLTLRQAADQLEAANTPLGRIALADSLGFSADPQPVDAETAARLGLPSNIADVSMVKGRGALRVLLFVVTDHQPLGNCLALVAAALSANTAHVLWLIIGAVTDDDEVGIACWSADQRAPRMVALVAHRRRIVASDAETICLLAATRDGDDLLVHTRWCELFGREALSRRFYRVLEQRVRALADSLSVNVAADRAELALLCVSRLIFLSFLEAKGWLDGDRAFLSRRFDACMASGGRFHARVLLPLFFGTLNTPTRHRAAAARRFGSVPFLNGGLFARGALERRHASARFSDEAMGALFGLLLGAYRFTAREGHADWSSAAIDPEMLGRAFESLMASRERRTSGAFYTPQPMVAHVVDMALAESLSDSTLCSDDIRAAMNGSPVSHTTLGAMHARLRTYTVLDPACGSGAFLVFVLERLALLHRACGDPRSIAAIRREVLSRAIHGVDVNPTAVWLCELRLWLSVVIESDETRMSSVPPLPNLDCNVRIGDALSGDGFVAAPSLVGPPSVLVRLRERYVRAAGPRKAPLRRAIEREERLRAVAMIDVELASLSHRRRERLRAQRAEDLFGERARPGAAVREAMRLERLRAGVLKRGRHRLLDGGALPFSFPSHFGAAHARGGFDLVVGNPPWVRLHNIPVASRAALKVRYRVYREAAWERGATGGHAMRGFSAQVDLSALFVERSVGLAAPDGCVALVLPAKLWCSLAGGGVRRMLGDETRLRAIEDWSEAPASFDAAVYPSVLIASRARTPQQPARVTVRRRTLDITWCADDDAIRLDRSDSASPWLLLPREVRHAFDRIIARGAPLADAPLGRATLGVKCGCNDAFIVQAIEERGDVVDVECQGRLGSIERDRLRPLLRGDAVSAWSIPKSRSAIIWTHDAGRPLRALPPLAARWLAPWRRQLLNRTDLRGGGVWWTLFRTEAADCTRPRVVWSDFGRTPRAALLPAGDPTVPLNSCYVIACDDTVDALALTALLNTPIAAAFLNTIAEPARGGWRRYLAWTVALLRVPQDWERARTVLAPIAERALLGNIATQEELLVAACHAYRLRRSDIAPLVAWSESQTNG
ncbi:MAG: N-6 DNA methylase [Gemmatimonadota bacterium]|nr:N-6 DNA methylase [Gemmatimonadota bacterium]